TNGAGVLRVRTTKCYEDSTVARILELVETAGERKAHLESFITRFARWYTPVVTLGAVLLALLPPLLLQASFAEWIHRACIFLIVSCPCALVISVPLGFFGGIGAASRLGVLVKGANFLEAAAELDTLVFDKTGTLTEGTFRLSGIYPAAGSGYTETELLRLAAIVESRSTHPIAQSICAAYRDVRSQIAAVQETESLEAAAGTALPLPEKLQEFAGMGISARCDGRELLLVSAQLMEKRGIRFQRRTEIGTAVYLACDGQFIGSIVIADAVKPGAEEAISALRKLGVRRCVMLSGDRRESAEAAAAKLGMDEVYSELLPEDKVQRVEALLRGGMASEGATEQEIAVSGQKPGQRRGSAEKERQSHGRLGLVGDGINDAPVLMRADVGIAMGSLGSDAAIEAADIVIMDDDIGKLAGIIRISRRTLRIVRQNVF
ncbi:MAG: heavy metal translocating P-type ATPase, partial [Lachnospiraceae bacterium]